MREVSLCITTFLWSALWQTPLIFLLALGLARAARTCGAAWEHRIWVGALVLELVLPGVSALPIAWLRRISIGSLWWHGDEPGQITIRMGAWHVAQAPGSGALPQRMLLVLCGMVSTAAALRLLWLYARTLQLRRAAEPLSLSGRAGRIWDSCCERFQLRKVIVAESGSVHGPMTCGVRRPWLLLPGGITDSLEDAELLTMFSHEAVHMQRNDFAKNLLYQVLALPLSWHPAIWLTRHRITASRECLCDELSATGASERESYARSLLGLASRLEVASRTRQTHAIGIFDANTLEDRIMRLTHEVRPASRLRRILTIVACVMAAVGVCVPAFAFGGTSSAGRAQSATAQEETAPAQVSPGVMAGNLESKVNPIYPPEAKAAGVQGSVVLRATIGTSGNLTALKLVSGPPELTKAAWTAVSQWTWKPYLLNGVPTAVQTEITVNFHLDR